MPFRIVPGNKTVNKILKKKIIKKKKNNFMKIMEICSL